MYEFLPHGGIGDDTKDSHNIIFLKVPHVIFRQKLKALKMKTN